MTTNKFIDADIAQTIQRLNRQYGGKVPKNVIESQAQRLKNQYVKSNFGRDYRNIMDSIDNFKTYFNIGKN